MIYPIVIYGHQVLRNETVDIDKSYPELDKLIEDMFQTMYNADGIGLAAPQIGLSIRLFVVDLTPMADEDEVSEFMGYKKVFINPRIVEYGSEEDTYREGCLSLPGINETVKRPTKIKIQYLNENFESIEEEIEGFKARAIQHEYDHLEGKVFVDRISPIRRQMNKSKLSGMAKGKVRCHYRVKTV
jgi:peptide deformylase